MSLISKERSSDSPYIEKIGHFVAENKYSHTCPAGMLSNMLIVNYLGKMSMTVWGPETKPGLMTYPKDAEFLFIRFKLGIFMPTLPLKKDTATFLTDAASQSFWLDSRAWQFPDYDNADTFVDWLVREGLLMREPLVDTVLQNHPQDMPARTVRHRFLRATGLTPSYINQLERAQRAETLLEQGLSILDTVDRVGYADQPHLTRSLKRFLGTTPAQIARVSQPE
jgi:AraC-like DNA-binding protein